MLNFLGGLIGSGLNFLGGQQSQQASIAAQEQINQQNLAEQENFAKNGVTWRVQDARNAGINPLAALGAQTTSFSNLVGPQVGQAGAGLAAAGQDISRAMQATRSPEDQAIAVAKTQLDLESLQLDNDLKRASLASSVARTTGAAVGPGISFPSKNAGRFSDDRSTPGSSKDYMLLSGPGGPTHGNPILSKSPTAQATGFDWFDDVLWQIRNRIPQTFGYGIPPELAEPAKGRGWYLDPDGVYRQYEGFGNASKRYWQELVGSRPAY